MIHLLALLLATPARAADTVLHAGQEPIVVLAKTARDTGRPMHDFRAATLPELLRGRPPVLLGEGRLSVCAQVPASEQAFEDALTEAETAMAFLEYDQALADLDTAEERLGCLVSPVGPDTASRMYFLRGLALHFAGDPEAARTAWTQAHRFDADLQWDDNFAPDPKPLFEEARAEADADADATLSVLPPLTGETLWVDGLPVGTDDPTVQLTAGRHLVQYGDASVTTVQLTAEPGTSPTVLFPHAVSVDAAGWVADPARRDAVATILAATLGEGAAAYVVHDGTTWKGRAGDPDWTALEAVPPGPDDPGAQAEAPPEPGDEALPAAADPPPGDEALPPVADPPIVNGRRTWYLAIGGASLAVASTGMATASWLRTKHLATYARTDSENPNDYQWYVNQHEGWAISYRVFTGLAIAGAGVAAVGVAVPLAEGVHLGPTGRGIRITLHR